MNNHHKYILLLIFFSYIFGANIHHQSIEYDILNQADFYQYIDTIYLTIIGAMIAVILLFVLQATCHCNKLFGLFNLLYMSNIWYLYLQEYSSTNLTIYYLLLGFSTTGILIITLYHYIILTVQPAQTKFLKNIFCLCLLIIYLLASYSATIILNLMHNNTDSTGRILNIISNIFFSLMTLFANYFIIKYCHDNHRLEKSQFSHVMQFMIIYSVAGFTACYLLTYIIEGNILYILSNYLPLALSSNTKYLLLLLSIVQTYGLLLLHQKLRSNSYFLMSHYIALFMLFYITTQYSVNLILDFIAWSSILAIIFSIILSFLLYLTHSIPHKIIFETFCGYIMSCIFAILAAHLILTDIHSTDHKEHFITSNMTMIISMILLLALNIWRKIWHKIYSSNSKNHAK